MGIAERMGWSVCRASWSSNLAEPTFYVYDNGEFRGATTNTWMNFTLVPGETLTIEVFDDVDDVAAVGFAGTMNPGWDAVAGARVYRIDQYVQSAWTEGVAQVMERSLGHYRWASQFLADGVVAQFRIVPLGTNNCEGRAREFQALIVRAPDAPGLDVEYSSVTGLVTMT